MLYCYIFANTFFKRRHPMGRKPPKPPTPAEIARMVDAAVVVSSGASKSPAAIATRKAAFLTYIGRGHSLSKAAQAVGVTLQTTRNWRQCEEFQAEFDDAELAYKHSIEDEVHERAFARGLEKSDVLLMFHAKRHIPAYKESHRVQVEHTGESISVNDMLDALRIKAIEALKANQAALAIAASMPMERIASQIDGTMVDITPVENRLEPTPQELVKKPEPPKPEPRKFGEPMSLNEMASDLEAQSPTITSEPPRQVPYE
jgi:hypothetical protein